MTSAGTAFAGNGRVISTDGWQPASPFTQIPLWPEHVAIELPKTKGPEQIVDEHKPVAGRPWDSVQNVTRPTMTVYPPKAANSGTTIMVFPGGGYRVLAMDLEGTEICDWVTAKGMTCVLLKYRVPGSGPYWNDDCNCGLKPRVPMALQDAQRAMVLLRQQATSLHIDPERIGVIGFSAGGHLVADISNRKGRSYTPVDAADALSARPDFAIALYPGHLWEREGTKLNPDIRVSAQTPPTFLLQAENDPVDDVRNSISYYLALKKVDAPVEMHLFARGGHAFGLRPNGFPITTEWPVLVEKWLTSINMLPDTQPR
nr:alpha/beta hydrolase [Luteibacter sp. Sphag1AF]